MSINKSMYFQNKYSDHSSYENDYYLTEFKNLSQNICQKENENVISFANRIRDRASTILQLHKTATGKADQSFIKTIHENIINCFSRGLKLEISKHLNLNENISDLMNKAVQIEKEIISKNSTSINFNNENKQNITNITKSKNVDQSNSVQELKSSSKCTQYFDNKLIENIKISSNSKTYNEYSNSDSIQCSNSTIKNHKIIIDKQNQSTNNNNFKIPNTHSILPKPNLASTKTDLLSNGKFNPNMPFFIKIISKFKLSSKIIFITSELTDILKININIDKILKCNDKISSIKSFHPYKQHQNSVFSFPQITMPYANKIKGFDSKLSVKINDSSFKDTFNEKSSLYKIANESQNLSISKFKFQFDTKFITISVCINDLKTYAISKKKLDLHILTNEICTVYDFKILKIRFAVSKFINVSKSNPNINNIVQNNNQNSFVCFSQNKTPIVYEIKNSKYKIYNNPASIKNHKDIYSNSNSILTKINVLSVLNSSYCKYFRRYISLSVKINLVFNFSKFIFLINHIRQNSLKHESNSQLNSVLKVILTS